MEPLQAALLGVVQGATEFLPVSSSGHLVLANYFFGWGDTLPAAVTFATNTGTLLAVVAYLRRDVALALSGFVRGLTSAEGRRSEGWRLALLVLVGSLPTAAIGLAFRPVFEALNAPLPVAVALIVTGAILYGTPRGGPKRTPRDVTFVDALIVGVVQGLAVIPGISRSGATIAALLWRGSSTDLAPRMSFLMYLVASAGVALLTLREIGDATTSLLALAAMTLASAAVGYVALILLFAVLRRGRFRLFAPYVWLVAALTLLRHVLPGGAALP
jgi:undecaprenyl-diphosphatase